MSVLTSIGKGAACALLAVNALWPAFALAQSAAEPQQKALDWLNRDRGAVVKLEVSGTTPTDSPASREGTGFFIYSGEGETILLTAAHVIGSNAIDQTKNDDWKVEPDGHIDRTIKVRIFNEHGALDSSYTEGYATPMTLPGDIAIVSIDGAPYPTLPLATRTNLAPHMVALLGFRKQSNALSSPPVFGAGQLKSNWKYLTKVESSEGESGGPLIDLETGKVVAIATGSAYQDGTDWLATPISLYLPDILHFLPALPPDQPPVAPRNDAIRDREAEQYRAAQGNLEKLHAYLSSCTICQYKADAQSAVNTLERQAQSDKEQAQYRTAHGNADKLRAYVASCSICQFKADAESEIATLERQAQYDKEQSEYRAAHGSAEKLTAYVDSCQICQFKDEAQGEIASLKRQAVRDQETAQYVAARGSVDLLQAYVDNCAICDYKSAAQTEILSLARLSCDHAMATKFDADLPEAIPPVDDPATLSDAVLADGWRGCLIAAKFDNSRRYFAQAGRAYAEFAKRAAATGDLTTARADMDRALDLWNVAMKQGSGAAMNFLGAYWNGTFNTRDIKFASPDHSSALRLWLQGADAGNVKSMRNAGAVLLVGQSDYPGVQRNVTEAKMLLAKASQRGDMAAAAILGEALYKGEPSEIGKNTEEGLGYLIKACMGGDPDAVQFFTANARYRHFCQR